MSKIKRKACKSLNEYRKIERKYLPKFFGNNQMSNHNYHNYWYTWIWYDIIGKDALNDTQLAKYAKKRYNLSMFVETVKKHYGWSYIDKDGYEYFLRGIEISNEDYYFIYISNTGNKKYSSCVGSYDSIDYRKNTFEIYNKETGKLEVECVPKCMIENFKEQMAKNGFDINNYNFVEYVGCKR